ncbi:hypothetical protein K3495_g7486 [Podosphaera aphanis]|nr:hypothetical protein K3495_g7486 [Podosphaera aphanis]
MFLSRLWKSAEARYWPTEMEIAGLCWIVQKIRHLIEACEFSTVIYPDHRAALQIATQSSLTTTSLVRMNMRHVRSSEFLNRFRLEIRHKPGKSNIVPDALSRLEMDKTKVTSDVTEELAFPEDVKCKRVLEVLNSNNELGENSANLPFEARHGLLYAKSHELHSIRRPVIPQALQIEVFRRAHDSLGHIGFNRIHERISNTLYMFNITKALRAHLWHCRECQVNRTPRHPPFGNLQPILTPPYLFHTISIDFILALPKTPLEGWDFVMTITDKFSKVITILPGKSNWSAEEWGTNLVSHLMLVLWGLPRAIISDRDRKFTSSIWRGIFSKLGVTMLFSTA